MLAIRYCVRSTSPGPNTDGIDPDSCDNVLIENYYYCAGDDAIAVKSGWNWAGIQFGMPSKNIVARNVTSACRGGFTIGSEMSGGVENVTFKDSVSTGQSGIRISSELGRGGYVKDVTFENIKFTWKEMAAKSFLFHVSQGYKSDNPNKTTSEFLNFLFKNLTAAGPVPVGDFTCLPQSPCHNITIDGLDLSGMKGSAMTCADAFGSAKGVTGGSSCINPEFE